MSHLRPEDLIDVADGAGLEEARNHAARCEICRRQVADVRSTLAAVPTDMPEPSPLFWEHLSTRVRDAVEAEQAQGGQAWFPSWRNWKVLVPAVAGAAAVLVLAMNLRTVTPTPDQPSVVEPSVAADLATSDQDLAASEDPTWALMSDLASGLDWDQAIEAGLSAPVGSVDRVIYDLNADERREFHRLLQQELVNAQQKGSAS